MLVTLGHLHRGIEHNRHPVTGSRRIDRHLLEGLVGRRRARPHDPGRVGVIVARRVNANPEDRAKLMQRSQFAQAAIGPGMAIYSRYSRILEASGKAMTVRTALALINQTLTEVLSEQEDEFDSDTRWAIAWYEQHGFDEGDFGDAELLSKAKVTSVAGLVHSGIVHSRGGKVRLLRPEELPKDWDPASDKRLTNWELTHHLLRVYYHEKAGEIATAELLRKIGAQGELARDLAYRLFDLSERKNRSQEAQAYNALVLGWPEIARLARAKSEEQGALFEG